MVSEQIAGVRSVVIGIWVATGSRYETKETNGLSHFLEHMVFKGTKTRNARQIAESFDRIGGYVNAFTSQEYTCFFAKVLDEHGKYALDVLADMFFHSTFSTDALQKEKGVVFEEIKMYEDTPDEMVHDLLGEASFGDHPLGYPILGNEQSLNAFNPEMLRRYMEHRYTPENVVISLAGHIDDSLLQEANQLFGSYQNEAAFDVGGRPSFHTDKIARQKDTEQAHLCLGFNGLSVEDEDLYSLVLLNNILGGSMSSRLFQEVREDKGLAYSIFSYHEAYLDNGMLTIYGGTGAHQVDALYRTIYDILERLKQEGITSSELDNSKEQIKGSLLLSLESTSSRMSRNGKNELLLGRHRSLDDMIDEVSKVTKERVDALARSIFSDEFSCSLVSPDGKLPQALQ